MKIENNRVEICSHCDAHISDGVSMPVKANQGELQRVMIGHKYNLTHGGCPPCVEEFYRLDREEIGKIFEE